jgi:stage V sporulation protein D (sporulation-specific penicillin-binding protein)
MFQFKERKMIAASKKNKSRIILVFFFFCIFILAITFRIGWIQIVAEEKYSKLAIEQQTRDTPIPAKRGVIYDRNNKELAVSAVSYSIWARPVDIKENTKVTTAEISQKLSTILGTDQLEMKATIENQDKRLIKIFKNATKEKADLIRKEKLPGISIVEDVRRFYPLGNFASHVLGSTTDDNRGLAGIELKYDRFLSGIPGRSIKNTDVIGNNLSYGTEKYFQAENGYDVVLTIDEVIQHYLEKALVQTQKNTNAARVMSIVLNPKTGEILAMGIYPSFDPNNPRTPVDAIQAEYVKTLPNEQKQEYWNAMWRNPLVSDTYEPGSTFKLVTTAIALEEGLASLNENFYCSGYLKVGGEILKCWRFYDPHGLQTLTEAVENSCNPVFMELGLRIGKEKLYQYIDSFGISEKTGIDFPGETSAILQDPKSVGDVALATISYGQGISMTPIELIMAISAIGNGGVLMEPQLVKELRDDKGNVVQTFEPKIVRKVISKETSDEMKGIMEAVVVSGTGANARIPGYRIGGKTGTADKVINGAYASGKVYSSFIALAPIEDPELAVLMIVDEPKGTFFGSQTAAPGVKSVLENTLRYLKVEPSYTPDEIAKIEANSVIVPDIIGQNFNIAKNSLSRVGLNYSIWPEDTILNGTDFIVIDQYPKAGEKLQKGQGIYIYKQ